MFINLLEFCLAQHILKCQMKRLFRNFLKYQKKISKWQMKRHEKALRNGNLPFICRLWLKIDFQFNLKKKKKISPVSCTPISNSSIDSNMNNELMRNCQPYKKIKKRESALKTYFWEEGNKIYASYHRRRVRKNRFSKFQKFVAQRQSLGLASKKIWVR